MTDPATTYWNWNAISEAVEVPLQGISFTFAAFECQRQRVTRESGGVEFPQRHCSAAEFCRAFIEQAKNTFGDDYAAALASWHLESSEKVGKLVFALVARNLIGKQDTDLQSDFDTQFDFSNSAAGQAPARVYHFPTTHLPPFLSPPRRARAPIAVGLLALAVWFATVVIGSAVAERMGRQDNLLIVHLVAIALASVVASKYPYRFSLRAALITMTVLALTMGLIAFLMR